jgi:unsaturated chondroitin disaccharide hydrolase
MMKLCLSLSAFVCLLATTACQEKEKPLDVDANLKYCSTQALQTLSDAPAASLPRNIDRGNTAWRYVSPDDWTSGFWPGILWYLYESTGDSNMKLQQLRKRISHNAGFRL